MVPVLLEPLVRPAPELWFELGLGLGLGLGSGLPLSYGSGEEGWG